MHTRTPRSLTGPHLSHRSTNPNFFFLTHRRGVAHFKFNLHCLDPSLYPLCRNNIPPPLPRFTSLTSARLAIGGAVGIAFLRQQFVA